MIALDDPAEPISGEAFEPGEKLPELPGRALIHRFLDQQAQEIAIRSQELQIRQLEIKAGYRFSRASLDAQQTDLKDKRSEERKKRRDQLFFVGFVTVVLIGLVVYLLQSGKEGLAHEILKALVYITTAATSGFYAGKSSERKKREAENSD
ncbi:MAG TPA: hypothetical protein VFS20_10425 [Longimicrobium sp.]|nr:hypothetical protein [Longimicrobium sp.]